MKKTILLAVALFLSCVVSYAAEDAMRSEAVNYFIEALQAQQSGNSQEAVDLYRKAALIEGKRSRWAKFAANNIGVIYMEEGELNRAEASFREALKIDPNYNPAQMNLGLVYSIQGNKCKATQYWLKVLGFDIDYLRPHEPLVEDGTGTVCYIDP